MHPTSQSTPASQPQHHRPSSTELLSSAKLVADAAQATLHNQSNKVDKARVADAAADLLDAASHYGKLENKSYGKYVEKAENYLHQYGGRSSSQSIPPNTNPAVTQQHSAPPTAGTQQPSLQSQSRPSGDGGHSGGGYGGYLKMAEGFLKKD